MSFFSLPISSSQRQRSIISASRRRRSTSQEYESDIAESDRESSQSQSERSSNVPRTLQAPYSGSSDLAQRRLAGLEPDEPLPQAPFPHAPLFFGKGNGKKYVSTVEELQYVDPPLYQPESFSKGTSLRLHHFSVLTTILHRCLLEGDYVRASRAWGILLRDGYAGNALDVRADGRWGIGAEILLHRGTQAEKQKRINAMEEDFFDNSVMMDRPWFTRQGFREAKAYYERLIVQYPFQALTQQNVNSLDFYPAMFGLWIYIVQFEGKTARVSIHAEDFEIHELEEAQEIAALMDRIMASPPFSDHAEMLRLRGMVALWIGDLSGPEHPSEHEGTDTMDVDIDPVHEREAEAKKNEQVIIAKRNFRTAKRRGADLPVAIESLLKEDDEEGSSSGHRDVFEEERDGPNSNT